MSSSDEDDFEPFKDKSILHKKSSDSELSHVSMRSDQSKDFQIEFREGESSGQRTHGVLQKERSDSSKFSHVSMRSDHSKDFQIEFRKGESSEARKEWTQEVKQTAANHSDGFNSDATFMGLEHHDICLSELNSANQSHFKSRMQQKFQTINEGISVQWNVTLLNSIFTELFITEGGSSEVNDKHEVRQIEAASRWAAAEDTPVKCNDIFKPLHGQGKAIRTVMTIGIAGIGKTVSVQKFVLDWAEGKSNQDVDFVFALPFRELNMIKGERLSLIDLLHHFFTETKRFNPRNYSRFKAVFIFDGLDECRLPMDFQNNESLFDVRESAPLDVLLTNLIKGNLLPSAHVWITSRPAAATQIPAECVDRVTEVRGFSDPQKEEYFRKRISNVETATKIITHVKSSRSLYIMCHMPIFCWISATVLERMLFEAETEEIPKTLTQMFTNFLIFQTKRRNQKYHGRSGCNPDQIDKTILALGKLAFQQLDKGNLIFYEEDLRECGIDVKEASVYSGICTEIFMEEYVLHLGKVYSFVHMSVQEHLAALYAFFTFINRDFTDHQTIGFLDFSKKTTMSDFLKNAVDKALQSNNGHLDLFLRFLLGFSLESNQSPLQSLLRQKEMCSNEDITQYIKDKIKDIEFPEKSINLFHCLNELNDHSLVQEVQTYFINRKSHRLHRVNLSPAQWSAVVYVILNSVEELEEFKLWTFESSEECLLKLLPVVKASRKALLCECNLSVRSCAALASVLSTKSSDVKELDMSNNDLQDSGVKLLSSGLQSPHCKLEILRLGECNLTKESCAVLASALCSNASCLRELRLSRNKLQDSGAKLLSTALESPNCKLKTLRLNKCDIGEEGCVALASALKSNPSHLRYLDLGRNKLGESGVKLLANMLADSRCEVEILRLFDCTIIGEGYDSLISALRSNPSHLKELDLGWNKPAESGIKLLSDLLADTQCKLKILKLHESNITGKGCEALASALKSNPSNLRELDLSNNHLGQSGIQPFSILMKDANFKEVKLEF